MLHRLEMAQGYVVPVVEAVENCSTCFHCDGNTAPICGWLRDTQLHHNILPLPDICTYFQYIHSTCKEIFPTWVDAEYWLSRLVEESYYGACLSYGSDWQGLCLSLFTPLPYGKSIHTDLIDYFPEGVIYLVRQILSDVVSEYFPPAKSLEVYSKNPHNFTNQQALLKYVDGHVKELEYSGKPSIKVALRRAFGLGLIQSVSVECKITCDGEQFEKK